MDCNWKVFVDNYLDGGLHVPVAHKGLADNLDFGSYTTQAAGPHAVVQSVGGRAERVGGTASYTYIWPNLMLNRYGGGDGAPRWLDANLVVTGARRARAGTDRNLCTGRCTRTRAVCGRWRSRAPRSRRAQALCAVHLPSIVCGVRRLKVRAVKSRRREL